MTATAHSSDARSARTALVQGLVLVALTMLAFRSMYAWMFKPVLADPESAHALAIPLLVLLLLLLRRRVLAAELAPGSPWGVLLIAGGLAAYAMASWPFNFGYPRGLAQAVTLGGVVLAVAGWRVLARCIPMLILVAIALPIGARFWAFAIIVPETLTLEAVRGTLDLLPGVMVELHGPDLLFTTQGEQGTIALGEHHRGASMFLSYLAVGVFVTFSRIRPLWQVIAAAIAVGPIILVSNFLRPVIWGLVTIYGGAGPVSPAPRIAGIVGSLVAAYCMFVGVLAILDRVFVEPAADEPSASVPAAAPGSQP